MNQYLTGAVIKDLREKNNLTQAELAEKLCVSDKTVSKWETGKGYPDISLLQPIAQTFGISVAELLSGMSVSNVNVSANMMRSKFYVCPVCGNSIVDVRKALGKREMNTYKTEVKQKWGDTDAYKEYEEKSRSYSQKDQQSMITGMDSIMAEFAVCMQSGAEAVSDQVQALVKKLQDYITANFYTCTDQILAGLGQMYVADERFKENIDKHGAGTAEYIRSAIGIYSGIE